MDKNLFFSKIVHTSDILNIKFLSLNRFATCSSDNLIKIHDSKDGNLIRTLSGHLNKVNSLEILPNNYLASGSSGMI